MLVFIFAELVLMGLCLFPIQKLGDRVYRWVFCIINSILLVIFQFYLASEYNFATITAEVVRNYTLPIKREINNWRIFRNYYYNPNFLSDHFVFIDTSNDLVANVDNDPTLGPFITDRTKLIRLFKILEQKADSFNTIVCDISLQDLWMRDNINDTTNRDLRQTIERLGSRNKIIQAVVRDREGITGLKNAGVPVGWVDNPTKADDYYFHVSITAEQSEIFLSYMLYRTITAPNADIQPKLEWKSGIIASEYNQKLHQYDYIMPRYIPEFYFVETEPNNLSQLALFPLGSLIKDSVLLDMNIYRSRTRPVIMVGNFKSRLDEHRTIYGDMHGGFILANIYYSLIQKQHQISVGYLLFLFIVFTLLSRVTLQTVLKTYQRRRSQASDMEEYSHFQIIVWWQEIRQKTAKWLASKPHPLIIYLYLIFRALYKLIFDNSVYIALLLIVFVADLIFNHVLNILGLAVYIFCYSQLLSQLVRYELSIKPKAIRA